MIGPISMTARIRRLREGQSVVLPRKAWELSGLPRKVSQETGARFRCRTTPGERASVVTRLEPRPRSTRDKLRKLGFL